MREGGFLQKAHLTYCHDSYLHLQEWLFALTLWVCSPLWGWCQLVHPSRTTPIVWGVWVFWFFFFFFHLFPNSLTYFLCARYNAYHFPCINSFHPHIPLRVRYCCYPCYTKGRPEAWSGKVTYPQSPSWEMVELEFEPMQAEVLVLSYFLASW